MRKSFILHETDKFKTSLIILATVLKDCDKIHIVLMFLKQRFNRKLKYDLYINKVKQTTDNSITLKKHRLTRSLPLNNRTPYITSIENWNLYFGSIKIN